MFANMTSVDCQVSSEESIAGPGLPYTPILAGNGAQAISRLQERLTQKSFRLSQNGVIDIGKDIVDITRQNPAGIDTLSLADMSKVKPAVDAVKALADAMQATTETSAVLQAIQASENYGRPYEPYIEIRDVQDLCDNIALKVRDPAVLSAAAELRNRAKDLIIDNENNTSSHPHSHGVSLYCGPDTQGYSKSKFADRTGWAKAMAHVWGGDTRESPLVWPDGSPRHPRKDKVD